MHSDVVFSSLINNSTCLRSSLEYSHCSRVRVGVRLADVPVVGRCRLTPAARRDNLQSDLERICPVTDDGEQL